MAGTAVFRMVVSSDSMKNANATSHGSSRLLAAEGVSESANAFGGPVRAIGEELSAFRDYRCRECSVVSDQKFRDLGKPVWVDAIPGPKIGTWGTPLAC
jgi:hypothetical protein